MPASSSMKAPKFAVRRTVPSTESPTLYLPSTRDHGSGLTCFMPREMRCLSLSTLRTLTSTSSPTLTKSAGLEM